ncbi:MAG: aromatic ring-hydroxylating dioxygenase subunit alpha [Acidimicrobiales bacterium]|nr:aromatic ring-hydroxylating dioxygenase subunit alpha [Acidimicrobiales bacterium]
MTVVDARADLQDRLWRALELCWHPVCSLAELAAADGRPIPVRLLGRDLAIADLGDGRLTAVRDRCPHRSTRLSVGWVEDGSIRCAYHGWRFGSDGRCVDIPAMPDGPIPSRACVDSFDVEERYGLVWVRLDPAAGTAIPACPAFDDPTMRRVMGAPYTWPTGAPRRVENFVDLAHFAWVHDGSLGRRDEPVPPLPAVERVDGELRFQFDPPEMETDETALFGFSRYRMPIPLTVDIEFELESGARRFLWMTASPVDPGSCRTFWFVSRDDDLDGDDGPHLDFQALVLAEDEPVVCNQDPPEMVLDPSFELSVRSDKVSIEYRRWLRELADAVDDPARFAAVLHADQPVPQGALR